MERCVEPELLDALTAADPRAVGSRRDLEKVNASMGNDRIMARTLQAALGQSPSRRLTEIGAGDGRFALSVAQRLPASWRGTRIQLVDRVEAVQKNTLSAFARLEWRANIAAADIFNWLEEPHAELCDAMVANLFLHHFSDEQLVQLLREAANRTRTFIAIEPRRSAWCLGFSKLLWFLGCNDVTRHDAPVSVRAGFSGRELSKLWPGQSRWILEEGTEGRFSHLFVARRKN